MQTFESILKRSSVREYLDKEIPIELLENLVNAGRSAPSARALEPWEFVVVTNKEKLAKLGDICDHGKFIKNAATCIIILSQDTKYFLEDGCAACENILLAAADMNLGACWVAGDKKDYRDEVLRLVKAPPGLKLVSLISLGWPKREIIQKKNRKLEEVIHWENY